MNRAAWEVTGRVRLRQHGSLDTATSVVTHDDDMCDTQSVNSVRQNANRVVIDRPELVRDVPLDKD